MLQRQKPFCPESVPILEFGPAPLLDEAQTLPSEEADREMMMRTVLKACRTGA